MECAIKIRYRLIIGFHKRTLIAPPTSAQDDDGQEQSHVAVIQLQHVELDGELELGLHHLAEGLAQALEELAGHEDLAVGDERAVFVHERRHHDDEHLDHAVLQQRDLVVEVQADEARDALGELGDLADGFGRARLAAVEEAQLHLVHDAHVGPAELLRRHLSAVDHLLALQQRLHVVNHERLWRKAKLRLQATRYQMLQAV